MILSEKSVCRAPSHVRCFACGSENSDGLALVFRTTGEQTVGASCCVDERYQGYPGVVQGGIVATMLDSAMTNCLFTIGVEALTVSLNVRYASPVLVGEPLAVEAGPVRRRGRLYELEARVIQRDSIKTTAFGRFMVPKHAL